MVAQTGAVDGELPRVPLGVFACCNATLPAHLPTPSIPSPGPTGTGGGTIAGAFTVLRRGAATAADALQARTREKTNKLPRPSRRYGDIERAFMPVLPR